MTTIMEDMYISDRKPLVMPVEHLRIISNYAVHFACWQWISADRNTYDDV
jgi:hypothetical protein